MNEATAGWGSEFGQHQPETREWRTGGEMLTPAGMLQLFHGNSDVGCLEKPYAEAIVKRLNAHDSLVAALEEIQVQTHDPVIERLCAAVLPEAQR